MQTDVTALFDSLRGSVLHYLLSIGLPANDTEEIVQGAFLAIFKHLRKQKPRENLLAWIFRVAHNLGLKRRSRNSFDCNRHAQIRI